MKRTLLIFHFSTKNLWTLFWKKGSIVFFVALLFLGTSFSQTCVETDKAVLIAF